MSRPYMDRDGIIRSGAVEASREDRLREELRALVDDTRRDSDTIDRLEAERDRLRELVHRHQEEFVRFEDRENRLREALDEIHRIAEDDDNRDYGSRGMDALVQIAALSDKDPA